MRYLSVEEITFVDINGKSYPIKDIREIEEQTISREISIKSGDMLDEIASRDDVFGEGGEQLSYKLFDANIIAIVENGFSIEGLKKLKIPVL